MREEVKQLILPICQFVSQFVGPVKNFKSEDRQGYTISINSTSLWGGAYPGVLSDTPTDCVAQCANVPSLKQKPDTMH